KELLGERVAYLHARALGLAFLGEILGREGGSVNTVPAGARANGEDRVAHTGGLGANELVLLHDADAHRVDQRVALVRRIKDHFTCNGRDADGIAVVSDALHGAAEQVAYSRAVQRSEAKRGEHRDGAGAYG